MMMVNFSPASLFTLTSKDNDPFSAATYVTVALEGTVEIVADTGVTCAFAPVDIVIITTNAAALKNVVKLAFTTRIKCFFILIVFKVCKIKLLAATSGKHTPEANNQKEMAIYSLGKSKTAGRQFSNRLDVYDANV